MTLNTLDFLQEKYCANISQALESQNWKNEENKAAKQTMLLSPH